VKTLEEVKHIDEGLDCAEINNMAYGLWLMHTIMACAKIVTEQVRNSKNR